MLAALFVLLGASILLVTLFDLIKTTLVFSPYGGPLTAKVAQAVWSIFTRFSGHRRSNAVGPSVLLAMLLTWLVFSWVGWTLLFSATEGAVVYAQTGQPASLAARIYFVGYSLFTLGIGDYRPTGAVWQFATVLCAAQGFAVITLSITYIVPIVSAVTQKRQLAALISLLGTRPETLVVTAWNGRDFGRLEQQLSDLIPRLIDLQLQHDAYPVLHYFSDTKRQQAVVAAVAVLDDALTLLVWAVREEVQPDSRILRSVRQAIGDYLGSLEAVHIRAAAVTPPLPSPTPLRSAGVPVVSETTFRAHADVDHRRRLLSALLERDGWAWREGET